MNPASAVQIMPMVPWAMRPASPWPWPRPTPDHHREPRLPARFPAERELGGGGACRVFLSRDAALGRSIVVKALLGDRAQPHDRARFRREIAVTARLQHPNIVAVLAAGHAAGGDEYYTMPYLDGGSLRDLLRGGALPVSTALRIARELAAALHYTHARDIVHRDVKPANVLFSDGHPVLVDFGIAYPLSTFTEARLTTTGLLVGTPIYMSPEQSAGDAAIDGRTDVYALGCVLHEMLTGQPPFHGRDDVVLCRRLRERPPRPSALRPELSPEVDAVVTRALAPLPTARFATAAELGAAIARAERRPVRGRLWRALDHRRW
ncbi:MAG TPA: serine/threonine-protein kinase [Gemmatimonadaceae bacterium]|nr:serine/threonine-protein kinase [Gemmatimonadaceae bacterium]